VGEAAEKTLANQKKSAFQHYAGYCCSQFAVHREAVRAYPKSFYQSLLKRALTRPFFSHDDYRSIGRDFEYLWHVIFTGTPINEHEYTSLDFTS